MKPPFVALAALICLAGPALAQPRGALIASCAACHGEDGIAKDAEVPHLAAQNERYMYNQMMAFRSGRRPHPEMRYMARELSQQDIADMVRYYASLPAR